LCGERQGSAPSGALSSGPPVARCMAGQHANAHQRPFMAHGDPCRLPASAFRSGAHFQSSLFSSLALVVPLVPTPKLTLSFVGAI
jgi:hypothetical protein